MHVIIDEILLTIARYHWQRFSINDNVRRKENIKSIKYLNMTRNIRKYERWRGIMNAYKFCFA